jgi:two-component system, LytTR family, sensor kinase
VSLRRYFVDLARALVFWLAAAALMSWQVYRDRVQEQTDAVYADLLLLYSVRYISIAILTPAAFYLARRWPVTDLSLPRATAYVLGYPVFCGLFALVRWCLLPPWMNETLSWGDRSIDQLQRIAFDTFADLFLLYAGLLCAAHAHVYFVRNRQQEIESVEMRRQLLQSELQTLRAQLQPHFIFNTLQGISTLIETAPQAAQALLEAFANLLRVVIKHRSDDFIPFNEEVRFVETYLSIEKTRLGRRLQVRWDISPDTYSVRVPQLILQPLIENAVVHGIACAREGGWLAIEARLRGRSLYILITNSVLGESLPGFGLALVNTRARLRHLYGDAARFEFRLEPLVRQAYATLELTCAP